MDRNTDTEHVLSLVLELDLEQLQLVCKGFRINQIGIQQCLRGRIMSCLSDRPEQLNYLKHKILQVYNAGIQYSNQQFTPQLLEPIITSTGESMVYNFNDTPFMRLLNIQFNPMVFIVSDVGTRTILIRPTNEDFLLIDESWDNDKHMHKIQIVIMFKSAGDIEDFPVPMSSKRLPHNITIAVNDTICKLPEINFEEADRPWRPNVPIEITTQLNPSDVDSPPANTDVIPNRSPETINISWTNESSIFTVGVFMVEKIYCEQLIDRIGRRRSFNETKERIIRQLRTADADMCIETMHVSIMDPISRLRIKLPARGYDCAHLQCFDAHQFLQMNEEKETWRCPFCGNKIIFENILIDEYFSTVLRSRKLSKDAEFVTLFKDGTWAGEKKKR